MRVPPPLRTGQREGEERVKAEVGRGRSRIVVVLLHMLSRQEILLPLELMMIHYRLGSRIIMTMDKVRDKEVGEEVVEAEEEEEVGEDVEDPLGLEVAPMVMVQYMVQHRIEHRRVYRNTRLKAYQCIIRVK
jgi:hypothetical protein